MLATSAIQRLRPGNHPAIRRSPMLSSLAVSGKARLQVAGLVSAADLRRAGARGRAACRLRSSRPRSELQRDGDDGATHADHRTPSIHSPQKIAYCLFHFSLLIRVKNLGQYELAECDIVIVILLCTADHSTRGFWFSFLFLACSSGFEAGVLINMAAACQSATTTVFRNDFTASTIIIIRLIISSLVVSCCRSKEIDGPWANIGGGF
jgi:hypothetical protein